MREKVVPAAKGLSPILGKQRAEDVGYGLRGALSITPFRKFKDKYKPETERQKQASKLGRGCTEQL